MNTYNVVFIVGLSHLNSPGNSSHSSEMSSTETHSTANNGMTVVKTETSNLDDCDQNSDNGSSQGSQQNSESQKKRKRRVLFSKGANIWIRKEISTTEVFIWRRNVNILQVLSD